MRPLFQLGTVLLLAVTGCTISIQPWTKPLTPPPSPPTDGMWNPASLIKNGPPPNQNPAVNAERTSEMIRQLNDEQEMRKALQEQVVTLKKQLKDSESQLQTANYEMGQTTDQMRKTREEFKHWQGEMDEMRERIRKMEEYRMSVKPLIEDLYRYIDRDKEPGKLKLPTGYNK